MDTIPVGEATELQQATIRRPSFGPGGSPQAQAYQASRTAATAGGDVAAATPAATGVVKAGLRRIGGFAAKYAPPALLAQTAAETGGTDTANYEKRFGLQEGGSDGSVGGFARDVGIRALGAASDLGNVMTGGLAGRLYADKQEPSALAPAPAVAPPVTSNPAVAGTPAAGTPPPLLARPNDAAPVAQAAPDAIRRVGNTFTNVPGGENFDGHNAGVSTIGHGQTASSSDVIRAGRALDGFGAGAHNADGSGGGVVLGSSGVDGANSIHNRDFSAGSLQPGQRSRLANASAERIASMRESGENARATASNNLQRGIHADNNDVSIRGQDATLLGHRMANDIAVAQAKRDQGNKDRQFSLDEDKYGTEKANSMFTQRQAATKDLHDEVGNMIPAGPDGKPDTQTAARYATGLSAMVGERQLALQNHLAQNPQDAQARAELAHITDKGVGALDAGTKRKFIVGMQAKDLAEQNHSAVNPFGGTAVQSDAPVTGMTLRKGLITDDYVTNRGDVIPARAVDRPGSTLGLGGRRDTNFDPLKKTIRGQ